MSQAYQGRKTIVITGSTSGIGLATATALARAGHRPVVVGKTESEVASAVAEIERETGARVAHVAADLSSPEQVDALARRLVAEHARIDVLINNAGVLSERLVRTPEGHELTWATNVLAPFRLTARLLPHLRRSGAARIINVASTAHRNADGDFSASTVEVHDPEAFDGFLAYARSKLALVAFTRQLAARVAPSQVVVHSLHPGIVATSLPAGPGRVSALMRFGSPLLLAPRRGAVTPVFLSTTEDRRVTDASGHHWYGRRIVRPSKAARDPALAAQIWALAAKHTGLEPRFESAPIPD